MTAPVRAWRAESLASVDVSTEVITRPPRRPAPPLPDGELALEPPPAIPQPTGARWQQWLSVLPMLAGMVATALMFGGREGAGPYTYVIGAIFGLSTLGMLITNWSGSSGPRKAELLSARRDYLRYLSGQRRRVRKVITDQRGALGHRHPEPQTLWTHVLGPRIWERRPTDGDFGVIRVGVGDQTLATPLVAPVIDPTADLEPVTAGALRRFLDTYSVVPDLPISVAIRAFSRVSLVDAVPDAPRARALARAMVGQLAAFHAPGDLVVAALVAPKRRRDWDWLKWLPHGQHPSSTDRLGPRRLVATTPPELDGLLDELVANRPRFQPWTPGSGGSGGPSGSSGSSGSAGFGGSGRGLIAAPHVVVVVDGVDGHGSAHVGVESGLAGVTILDVGAAPARLDRSTIRLSIGTDGDLHSSTLDTHVRVGRPDELSVVEAETLARRLAPLRLSAAVREQAPLAADRDLTELLDIPEVATAELATLWAPRPAREVFRIPIGTGPDGTAVELDLKEAAQDGMGPHGLIVGATGSGKSELLRTLVLGLAVTHSSEALNFVLVDFKGGATFASLDALPHTSAVITNLADALPLVDRMKDAMSGELTRRQELLRRAGNVASLRDYDRARAAGADLPPLPSLLLVCDEFTEMLTAKPDFIDLFLQIGRIGRSIGVHLLLATQRLEEGRLRGLETNLSYRIALRTFTAHESRMTLGGVSDAAELPSSPGHGYLRVGTDALQRFKAAYSSGSYRGQAAPPGRNQPIQILDYTSQHVPMSAATVEPPVDPAAPTLMEVIVGRLAGQGMPAHRVWLPPLDEPPNVDDLLGGLATIEGRGVTTADAELRGALQVPLALVDKPYEQLRDTAWFDLAGSTGHVAIVGGPQSGKSTAVRTLATALALTHTPREMQIYCLDFGGGSLASLRDLPHVGGVAGRLDTAAVRRTVGEIATLLADRERRFAAYRIDDIASFRRMRRSSDLDATVAVPEDGFGDVFLVVDGWTTLRNEFEDLEGVLVDVATRGLSYGIHLVATATRWADLRQNVRDLLGSKIELRLGDPGDSTVNRKTAVNVPAAKPGRGLVEDGLHALTALPQAAGHPPAALVKVIAAAWPGPSAPAVRLLPPKLPYTALLGPTEAGAHLPVGTGLALPLGIAESDLRPVLVDFASEPHLVAFGDSECGKSTLLRSLAESIIRRYAPEQARIVLIDYRRSLLGAVSTDHLIGYGTAAENTAPLIESVADYMDKRRPGPDVTPDQLRDRSWWHGPECFVLVDDYDLVAAGTSNPLLPLLPYLSQARDVGLHLVVTRRAGGAGRAQYEPILQRLRELGTPGIVMAGDRDEGPLVGAARPGPLPPGRGWLVTRKEGIRLVQLALV
jgi:S-DNA-T family DNA segregation ATPase FtsK/SpoIIIE